MTFTYDTRTAKDGTITYTVRVDVGTDPVTGKRNQKRISAPTVKELKRLYTETLSKVQRGTYVEETKATVAEYLPRWLDAIKPTIRPASHDRYTRIVHKQIIPVLGTVPLPKLTPLAVQDWYARLLAANLSPSTVALYHSVLHRALDQAVKWQMIPRNVCDAVDAPRETTPELQVWTADQARAFLTATAGDELAAVWSLALYSGMRRGEMLALRWGDVDLDRGTVAVRRNLTRGADGLVFGEPKTKAGRRSIALPAPAVAALRAHKAQQNTRRLGAGEAWHDDDLVFDRGDGRVLHPNNITHGFTRAVKRYNEGRPKDERLPVIRLHDLRHTAATLMLALGEHPKIVQERLGHSDISMTLGRYSHVTMDMQRDAADRLGRLLGS